MNDINRAVQQRNCIPGTEGEARLNPKLWDYSCYLLRCLKRNFERIIRDAARSRQSSSILCVDFGCGTRPYEQLFKDNGIGYIGADLSENQAADIAINSDGTVAVEGESADIVFSSQVLEHVYDVPSYLSECRRLLKPDGYLILSTHGFWTYHGYPDDFHRWTFHGLKRQVEDAGFTVNNVTPVVGIFAYTTHVRCQLVRGLLYKFAPWTLPFIGLVNIVASILMPLEDKITPSQVKYENSAIYIIEATKK
jgi:2-polyprenyl-3-methyl-5-hydroxy-6-metoxy-1,4-benzoquinol methylase